MSKIMKALRLFLVVFLSGFLVLGTDSVLAEVKSENATLTKGIYQFRQENYDEALVSFKKALEEDPDSSLTVYYIGLTYKRMEDYVSARRYLESSLNMTPKIKGALLELIDLLYRLGEYDEAKKWIKVAEDEGIRPAQAKFLKGLTLQKNGEYAESIEAFEEAKSLDDRLAQSANYQIGVSYLRMKKFRDARDLFNEAYVMDPYSEIGSYADKYITALDKKIESDRPFHFSAKSAFEYDSNVLLQPTDSALVVDITDQDDTRQVFDFKGDYTFKTEDNLLSLRTGYGFHLAKQNDFGRYDIMGHNIYAQPNVSLEKILVSFPVSYNHTIVDDKNYLGTVNVGNLNSFMVGDSQMAQAGITYRYDNYIGAPSIPEEERSGNELLGTAGWFWFFAGRKGFVNLKYTIDKDWAEGNNWENLGHKVSGGMLFPFWDKFKLGVVGEIFIQNFDNKNSIFDKKRADQVYTVGSTLTYNVFDNWDVVARYVYVNDRSNLNLYEYDRHIVSAGLQYEF